MAPVITCHCGECRKCKHRVYMRDYYRRNAEHMRETARLSQSRTRTPLGRHIEYRKHGWKAAPEKIKARNDLTHAIERGEVVRGECSHSSRSECRGRIEGHHSDYTRPLDVRWLCQRHHAELHRRF